MRILHLITTLDVGGAEMHLLAQVRGQAARGHAVRVAWLKGRGTLADDFRAAGAEHVERLGLLAPLALARRLRWAQILHTHLLKADMLGAAVAAACGARARLVASKHNDEQVLLRAPVALVHGLLGNLPRRTIVLSDHVGAFIARHGRVRREQLVRIYYGLDPAPFAAARAWTLAQRDAARRALGLEPADVVCICVARFAPQKAHDVLLSAFARARAANPRLRLLLVGDDPFGDGRARAERLAGELGLGPAVQFLGIRRDVPQLLALSEVFVMASLWEGLGLVFLEAMAAALPVLSTRVSAVPEVVQDGVTGRLVPPADAHALAAALLELAGDADLRTRLGAAGEQRVRTAFGLERMVAETLAVYETLGGAGRGGAGGAGA